MKVITLSKTFMKGHPREGQPTGFRQALFEGRKIHTIRANASGYFKDGDIISIREWSGKPYRSKQEVILDGVQIGIEPIIIESNGVIMNAYVGSGSVYITLAWLAVNDGLNYKDFVNWFGKQGEPSRFVGSIIHFTDFRYNEEIDE